jgi:hypothetical protein
LNLFAYFIAFGRKVMNALHSDLDAVICNPTSPTGLKWLRLEFVSWRQEFSFMIKYFIATKFGSVLGQANHLSNLTVVFLGIKRPEREANNAPPPNAVVRNVWKHPPPSTSHGMVLLLNAGCVFFYTLF